MLFLVFINELPDNGWAHIFCKRPQRYAFVHTALWLSQNRLTPHVGKQHLYLRETGITQQKRAQVFRCCTSQWEENVCVKFYHVTSKRTMPWDRTVVGITRSKGSGTLMILRARGMRSFSPNYGVSLLWTGQEMFSSIMHSKIWNSWNVCASKARDICQNT